MTTLLLCFALMDTTLFLVSEYSIPEPAVEMTFNGIEIRYEIYGEEVYPPFTDEQGKVWLDAMGGEFDTAGIRDLDWNKTRATPLTLEDAEEYLKWCEVDTVVVGIYGGTIHRPRSEATFKGFIEWLRRK